MGKEAIRQAVWDRLDEEGLARFPFPPHGRIPNFVGAGDAGDWLADCQWWEAAETIKCNPDAPQRPVRERALLDGITVIMAQPRLRSAKPFIQLDPASIERPSEAVTIGGADEHGVPLAPADVPDVDAIVVGSVAVDRSGRRIGKGEGYSDLEFAILLELGAIAREVTVATTVHGCQVVDGPLPTDDHDVPLDVIATQSSARQTEARPDRPDGIDWSLVDSEMRSAIPVLERLA